MFLDELLFAEEGNEDMLTKESNEQQQQLSNIKNKGDILYPLFKLCNFQCSIISLNSGINVTSPDSLI